MTRREMAALVEQHVDLWTLSQLVPIADTVMGRIDRVTQKDGTPAVLKTLSDTGRRHEGATARVLAHFGGRGAVNLIAATENAILMEFCTGHSLHDTRDGTTDRAAIPAIVEVVSDLRLQTSSPPPGIQTLDSRCQALERGIELCNDNATGQLFETARRLADRLIASTTRPSLLHGDLHHGNIMQSTRGGQSVWLAIDPQAVIGDPAYDLANIFSNPISRPDVVLDPERPLALATRFAQAFDDLTPDRILAWAYVHAAVSAAWAIEDGEDPEFRLSVAKMIKPML